MLIFTNSIKSPLDDFDFLAAHEQDNKQNIRLLESGVFYLDFKVVNKNNVCEIPEK
jgi:hypothetical protein